MRYCVGIACILFALIQASVSREDLLNSMNKATDELPTLSADKLDASTLSLSTLLGNCDDFLRLTPGHDDREVKRVRGRLLSQAVAVAVDQILDIVKGRSAIIPKESWEAAKNPPRRAIGQDVTEYTRLLDHPSLDLPYILSLGGFLELLSANVNKYPLMDKATVALIKEKSRPLLGKYQEMAEMAATLNTLRLQTDQAIAWILLFTKALEQIAIFLLNLETLDQFSCPVKGFKVISRRTAFLGEYEQDVTAPGHRFFWNYRKCVEEGIHASEGEFCVDVQKALIEHVNARISHLKGPRPNAEKFVGLKELMEWLLRLNESSLPEINGWRAEVADIIVSDIIKLLQSIKRGDSRIISKQDPIVLPGPADDPKDFLLWVEQEYTLPMDMFRDVKLIKVAFGVSAVFDKLQRAFKQLDKQEQDSLTDMLGWIANKYLEYSTAINYLDKNEPYGKWGLAPTAQEDLLLTHHDLFFLAETITMLKADVTRPLANLVISRAQDNIVVIYRFDNNENPKTLVLSQDDIVKIPPAAALSEMTIEEPMRSGEGVVEPAPESSTLVKNGLPILMASIVIVLVVIGAALWVRLQLKWTRTNIYPSQIPPQRKAGSAAII